MPDLHIALPGLPTVSGPVVLLVLVVVVLIVLAIIIRLFIRSARRRQRGPKSQLAKGRPSDTVASRASYRDMLDRIGGYLVTLRVDEICIGELADGYIVTYMRSSKPEVQTLSFDEVAALPALRGSNRRPPLIRQQLATIGHFLDGNQALSPLVTQQGGGYYVEYATPPSSAYGAAHLTRVSRFLDVAALNNLVSS